MNVQEAIEKIKILDEKLAEYEKLGTVEEIAEKLSSIGVTGAGFCPDHIPPKELNVVESLPLDPVVEDKPAFLRSRACRLMESFM